MFREIYLHDTARPLAARKEARRYCGPYRWTPARPMTGRGFYMASGKVLELASHGAGFRLRLEEGKTFRDWEGDDYTALVFRLPRGRGFLAGWTLGPGMCGSLDSCIWDDESDAMRAAEDEARAALERDAEARASYCDESDE